MSSPTGSTPPSIPPTSAGSSSPSFPPPVPSERVVGGRGNRLLVLVTVVSLAVAIVMTVLWWGARDDDEGSTGPVPETSEVSEAAPVDPRVVELEARVAAAEEAQARAEAEAEQLRAELRPAEEAENATPEGGDDLATALAEIEQLRVDLAAAEARAAESEADLVEARAALDAADTAAAEGAGPLDATETPEFARWIGELLSSRTGSSRLGETAAICFGTEVIGLIGVDAIGAGQHNAASAAARAAVIDAMNSAAATCGIDLALIFG